MGKKLIVGIALLVLLIFIYLFFACRVDIAGPIEKAMYPEPSDAHTASCGYDLFYLRPFGDYYK